MQAPDAIRQMIKTSGKSGRQVARDIGRSSTFVSASLSQNVSPRIDTFTKIANACNYDVVVVPRKDSKGTNDKRASIVLEYENR